MRVYLDLSCLLFSASNIFFSSKPLSFILFFPFPFFAFFFFFFSHAKLSQGDPLNHDENNINDNIATTTCFHTLAVSRYRWL